MGKITIFYMIVQEYKIDNNSLNYQLALTELPFNKLPSDLLFFKQPL